MRHARFPFRTYTYTTPYVGDTYVGISAGYTQMTQIIGLVALYSLEITPTLLGTEYHYHGALGMLEDSMGNQPWEYPEEAVRQTSSDGWADITYHDPVPGFSVPIASVTGTFTSIRPVLLSTQYPTSLEFDPPLIRQVFSHDGDQAFKALALKIPYGLMSFSVSFVFGYEQTNAYSLG